MTLLVVGASFLAFCGLIGWTMGGHSNAGIIIGLLILLAAEASTHLGGD